MSNHTPFFYTLNGKLHILPSKQVSPTPSSCSGVSTPLNPTLKKQKIKIK